LVLKTSPWRMPWHCLDWPVGHRSGAVNVSLRCDRPDLSSFLWMQLYLAVKRLFLKPCGFGSMFLVSAGAAKSSGLQTPVVTANRFGAADLLRMAKKRVAVPMAVPRDRLVLYYCESGSGASLGACNCGLPCLGWVCGSVVWLGCLTEKGVRESMSPAAGRRGFRGAVKICLKGLFWFCASGIGAVALDGSVVCACAST
jgi:hypothetical protein